MTPATTKSEILYVRLTAEEKAALKRRADKVAGGSMSLVIQRLITAARSHWPKDAATTKESTK